MNSMCEKPSPQSNNDGHMRWPQFMLVVGGAYVVSMSIVMLSVVFIAPLLSPETHADGAPRASGPCGIPFLTAVSRSDGKRYIEIAKVGYQYDSREPSNLAFFPAYPCAVRILACVTSMPVEWSALAVSHCLLLAGFGVFSVYGDSRVTASDSAGSRWALFAFALFPTTFFLRMTYSESAFFLLAVLSLLGIERRWPLPIIAAIIGLATATRPVGVALLAPLALHIVRRARSVRGKIFQLCLFLPIGCWGLGAFILFQLCLFGDPLAFVTSQRNHNWQTAASLGEKAIILGSLEPIWAVYDVSSPAHWAAWEPRLGSLFNLQFANPIFFVGAFVVVGLGARNKLLSGYEILVALGLLLIPYCTRSYEMCMAGHGRFVAVVFPIFFVLGRLLSRSPRVVRIIIVAVFAFYLGAYSAFFAAGYLLG